MALPLLQYNPSSQNHRVDSFGVADQNEDTPYIYRIEDVSSYTDMTNIIWAAYRQVFSEHEILKFNRQGTLESQLKNGSLSVRDFIRGLAKSEAFYRLVVSVNNNYRLVDITLKRLLGRCAYNKKEEIAWSIVICNKGFGGFVDALLDSEEYTQNFGDNTVPYQRKRFVDRPFNLVTPRYGADFQETAGTVKTDWRFTLENFYTAKAKAKRLKAGDPGNFEAMAASVSDKGNYAQKLSSFDIDYLNAVPYRGKR
ncbi:phycobilisome rod-core linker polypeptide [Dolichospermum compactum]|uniref:Phycobilisome linker polypeptide n=1 Tax=Dolichospermum compactum NIES-806 TaxID=1973481 RepID=A0A1Z4VAC2_9CYAN|nr:phycobilisome rod-core linker polypeptide [Dolichospermum compactum]BAZ88512.1 phycobilisome linker polypeptide [Dolichospermum compactum NIES-806]